jgi:cell wall-associated NlpC family hydrolase
VAIAQTALGQPYVWAGNAWGGFDCSGFVQWVYSQAGLRGMPRTIDDQLALGKKVEPAAIQPGDVLAFVNTYGPGVSHVGIALGDSLMIHAADELQGVKVSRLDDDYWKARFYKAVRLR